MSLLRLAVIVFVLSAAIGLTLWNPTMDDYLRFVEQDLHEPSTKWIRARQAKSNR